jgi:hypothetical protein
VNYLLFNEKKVCAIKLKTRTGRFRTDSERPVSFPKTIVFWCPIRLVSENSYQLKLRGVGVAALNIKAVYGRLAGGGYQVDAELTPSDNVRISQKGVTH